MGCITEGEDLITKESRANYDKTWLYDPIAPRCSIDSTRTSSLRWGYSLLSWQFLHRWARKWKLLYPTGPLRSKNNVWSKPRGVPRTKTNLQSFIINLPVLLDYSLTIGVAGPAEVVCLLTCLQLLTCLFWHATAIRLTLRKLHFQPLVPNSTKEVWLEGTHTLPPPELIFVTERNMLHIPWPATLENNPAYFQHLIHLFDLIGV